MRSFLDEISREQTNRVIRRAVEYYFGDNIMKTEKQLRLASESDDGYVGIDLLLTFSKLTPIAKDISEIVISVSDSSYLVFSEDKQRIKRLHSFCVPKKLSMDPFIDSLRTNQHITARKLWRQGIYGSDKEISKVEVLRKRRIHYNVLYCIGIFTSVYSFLETVAGEESYVCAFAFIMYMCMFVCMYVCMYVCIYVCIYTCDFLTVSFL